MPTLNQRKIVKKLIQAGHKDLARDVLDVVSTKPQVTARAPRYGVEGHVWVQITIDKDKFFESDEIQKYLEDNDQTLEDINPDKTLDNFIKKLEKRVEENIKELFRHCTHVVEVKQGKTDSNDEVEIDVKIYANAGDLGILYPKDEEEWNEEYFDKDGDLYIAKDVRIREVDTRFEGESELQREIEEAYTDLKDIDSSWAFSNPWIAGSASKDLDDSNMGISDTGISDTDNPDDSELESFLKELDECEGCDEEKLTVGVKKAKDIDKPLNIYIDKVEQIGDKLYYFYKVYDIGDNVVNKGKLEANNEKDAVQKLSEKYKVDPKIIKNEDVIPHRIYVTKVQEVEGGKYFYYDIQNEAGRVIERGKIFETNEGFAGEALEKKYGTDSISFKKARYYQLAAIAKTLLKNKEDDLAKEVLALADLSFVNCKNFRKDTETCKLGGKGFRKGTPETIKINPGDVCPFDGHPKDGTCVVNKQNVAECCTNFRA